MLAAGKKLNKIIARHEMNRKHFTAITCGRETIHGSSASEAI